MGGGRFVVFLLLALNTVSISFAANVTYDHRALVIDGKRRVLVSGSIHYPRSTPDMWPDLIQKSKQGGLDVIETYVFWNLHEQVRGQIENEYGNIDSAYGLSAKIYINWVAKMATSLGTGVPWVMCQQNDALDPIVSSVAKDNSFWHFTIVFGLSNLLYNYP
ncbi:Beta-galactosidase 8 [Abeliophyllum distichum]|uniref:beta-galactosidase n=1 Tax=Abeliophyllum distichum TaxID=126358 RepID=A0ABD1VPV2_9LAMI